MKKWLIIVLLISLYCIPVYAHPGRTDSSGGHHDYNNDSGLGPYHYHCNKHPPHLHENGICPYSNASSSTYNELDINTSTRSTNNIVNNSYSSIKVSESDSSNIESESKKEEPIESKNSFSFSSDWYCFALSGLLIVFIFKSATKNIEKQAPQILYTEPIRQELSPKAKYHLLSVEERINIVKKNLSDYDYYFSCYAFYSPECFCKVPKWTFFDSEGLPHTKNGGQYGSYTVYMSRHGSKYHVKRNCSSSKHIIRENIVNVCRRYEPCSRCVKKEKDLSWYWEYKRIFDIKKKYDIP